MGSNSSNCPECPVCEDKKCPECPVCEDKKCPECPVCEDKHYNNMNDLMNMLKDYTNVDRSDSDFEFTIDYDKTDVGTFDMNSAFNRLMFSDIIIIGKDYNNNKLLLYRYTGDNNSPLIVDMVIDASELKKHRDKGNKQFNMHVESYVKDLNDKNNTVERFVTNNSSQSICLFTIVYVILLIFFIYYIINNYYIRKHTIRTFYNINID